MLIKMNRKLYIGKYEAIHLFSFYLSNDAILFELQYYHLEICRALNLDLEEIFVLL